MSTQCSGRPSFTEYSHFVGAHPCGPMVVTGGFQSFDPGSIPGTGTFYAQPMCTRVHRALSECRGNSKTRRCDDANSTGYRCTSYLHMLEGVLDHAVCTRSSAGIMSALQRLRAATQLLECRRRCAHRAFKIPAALTLSLALWCSR